MCALGRSLVIRQWRLRQMIFSGISKYKKCIKNVYTCIVSENPNLYLMPKMQIQNSQKSFVNAAVICSLGYKTKIKQVTEVIYMRAIYLTTWGLEGSSCYPWFKFENWDAKVSSCTASSLPTATLDILRATHERAQRRSKLADYSSSKLETSNR